MKPAYKQIRHFLKSTEATASAFSSIGWDEEKREDERAFWCLVNYGILEELELSIVVDGEEAWFAELYLPPILPACEKEAARLVAELQAKYPPLVGAVDTDLSVILGAAGKGDPTDTLRALWRAWGEEEVYQAVLLVCSMTAPDPDEQPFDTPDDPFEE